MLKVSFIITISIILIMVIGLRMDMIKLYKKLTNCILSKSNSKIYDLSESELDVLREDNNISDVISGNKATSILEKCGTISMTYGFDKI